ncbi:toll/interleukin-1 receptor domain-containing protein, partial [Rhodococcus wratislaviensis]|uniref:toll/interleukin-1 receptor domain-containing protein n=1 Tax=Rhodococcus wratislaviensis TaxID=44752 RepID=UPI000F58E3E5
MGLRNLLSGKVGAESADSEPEDFEYDAFISYSHGDRPVASGIQKGLHRIGRRLGQLRALRVCRDATDLAAGPDLWGRVRNEMDRSRFLIVVLSTQSVGSYWVDRELRHWLDRRGSNQLLLVVADGRLKWDEANRAFDPNASDVAPPILTEPGILDSQPLYVDVHDDEPWDPRAPMFREKVIDLAAPIHGKPKPELGNDDARELRRFRRFVSVVIVSLVTLSLLASGFAWYAFTKRAEAERQRDEAVALLLESRARAILTGNRSGGDIRALQMLLAAQEIDPTPNDDALLEAVISQRNVDKIFESPGPVGTVAFTRDGQHIASGTTD